jgi:hypothetical protein
MKNNQIQLDLLSVLVTIILVVFWAGSLISVLLILPVK